MSIDNIIAAGVARAVNELYSANTDASSIVPQATRKEFEGNLTIVVFPWVKAAKKSPEAVGKEIGDWLVDNEPAVDRYNVVKGFRYGIRYQKRDGVKSSCDGRIFVAQHQQASSSRPCKKQSARIQSVGNTQGMWQPCSHDKYRE